MFLHGLFQGSFHANYCPWFPPGQRTSASTKSVSSASPSTVSFLQAPEKLCLNTSLALVRHSRTMLCMPFVSSSDDVELSLEHKIMESTVNEPIGIGLGN